MSENPMTARLKELYLPPSDDFVFVDVPELRYFMIDGEGHPDHEAFRTSVQWLWAAVFPIRRIAKERMGKHFVEPPLEGLWWADDPADLIAGNKDKLKWRMMIPAPEWADEEMFASALAEASKRLGDAPPSLRLDSYEEGRSVQIMYVGPYERDAAKLARRLHSEWLPEHDLVPSGPHHEIYLSDPRRTAPEKQRTVVRQPVQPA